MIFQLRHRGLYIGDSAALEEAQAEFRDRHCILMPNLLEPTLVQSVAAALDRAEFRDYSHDEIGTELCARPGLATGVLELLANDPQLFETIRLITGCGPIGCFHGRVYRMVPNSGHYDSWHSDEGFDRMVTMSINLSPRPYRGGVLQIREKRSTEMLREVANVGLGDGILFRIAPDLTHRVTDVEGEVPKTAYAGWFRSRPTYRELVRERVARVRPSIPSA